MWRRHSIGALLFLLIVAGWAGFYQPNPHSSSKLVIEDFRWTQTALNWLLSSANEGSSVGIAKKGEKRENDRKPSTEPCPDEKVYTGEYRNWSFGFSIVIPAGLKGYWNSPGCAKEDDGCLCMPDHGRIIPLSNDAQIEAYTGYKIEDDWSLRDYEREDVSYLRKKKGIERVEVISSKSTRLGNLRARRFIIKFIENNKNRVEDQIIALHDDAEYILTLNTAENRYQTDRHEFEKVVASWKLTPRLE